MSSNYMVFRCTFSITNLLFFILGLGIVVYSWLLHVKSTDYGPLMGNQWFTAPVILIISAKLSIFLGLVGCCGAWFEKKAILFLYIFAMVMVFIGLLFGVVFIIAVNEQVATAARTNLLENIRQHPLEEDRFRQKLNAVQRRLHCCGIDDYRDWFSGNTWSGRAQVPDSCCLEERQACAKEITVNETLGLIHPDGCFHMIQKDINRNLMVVGILSFVLVFVEGFCIVAALGLLCYLRQRDSYI